MQDSSNENKYDYEKFAPQGNFRAQRITTEYDEWCDVKDRH